MRHFNFFFFKVLHAQIERLNHNNVIDVIIKSSLCFAFVWSSIALVTKYIWSFFIANTSDITRIDSEKKKKKTACHFTIYRLLENVYLYNSCLWMQPHSGWKRKKCTPCHLAYMFLVYNSRLWMVPHLRWMRLQRNLRPQKISLHQKTVRSWNIPIFFLLCRSSLEILRQTKKKKVSWEGLRCPSGPML
jgi:hypothetical protein